MIVHVIAPEELSEMLQPFWNGLTSLEIEEYYLERMRECSI
jgi:hypothetical protein